MEIFEKKLHFVKYGFDDLVKHLRKRGYEVSISLDGDYGGLEIFKFARISGNNIRGGFAEENNGISYSSINGRITFDNANCFDKYNRCPYSFPIPETKEQMDYLIKKMRFIASELGFEKSNNYDIDGETDYPKNIR